MDSRPVIIGSGPKSHFSRKAKASDTKEAKTVERKETKAIEKKEKRQPRVPYKPRPVPEKVDVYIDEKFVRTANLKQLVRFSVVAAETFPRPQPDSEDDKAEEDAGQMLHKQAGDGIDKNRVIVTAPKIHSRPALTQEQADFLTLLYGNRSTKTDLYAPMAESAKMVTAPAAEEKDWETLKASPQRKVLTLHLSGVPKQPTTMAGIACLEWMDFNRSAKHRDRLTYLMMPDSANCPLTVLVDLQAAALSFELRPSSTALRQEILVRLSTEAPMRPDMQFVWEHLPSDDAIVKRMVTAYFEHWERYNYTDDESEAILNYVESIRELSQLFWRVQQSRRRFRAKADKEQGGDHQVENMTEGAVSDSSAQTGSRQPSHRRQQGKANATAGSSRQLSVGKSDAESTSTKDIKASQQVDSKPKPTRWQEAERRAEEAARKRD
ncbi:hypothetical protein LTR85_005054 [Meristemomyces frigidus]|nr:hypothetical protein LTR85_005054 [Meristemomyces frigidus]